MDGRRYDRLAYETGRRGSFSSRAFSTRPTSSLKAVQRVAGDGELKSSQSCTFYGSRFDYCCGPEIFVEIVDCAALKSRFFNSSKQLFEKARIPF